MGFRFSLAAVLRVRESLEKREERALQATQLEMARTVQQVEALATAIGGAHRDRERALDEGLPGGQLQSLLQEEQAAERRLTSLMEALRALEQARDEQLKVYQLAHQGRELLTAMRGKQLEIYDRERLREEQKRLDDIFMARRHRVL